MFPTPVYLSNLDVKAMGGGGLGGISAAAAAVGEEVEADHEISSLEEEPEVIVDPHPSNRVRVLPSSAASSDGSNRGSDAASSSATAAAILGRKLSGKMRGRRAAATGGGNKVRKRKKEGSNSYSVSSFGNVKVQ